MPLLFGNDMCFDLYNLSVVIHLCGPCEIQSGFGRHQERLTAPFRSYDIKGRSAFFHQRFSLRRMPHHHQRISALRNICSLKARRGSKYAERNKGGLGGFVIYIESGIAVNSAARVRKRHHPIKISYIYTCSADSAYDLFEILRDVIVFRALGDI